jgi:hypothetical protein
MRWVTEYLRCEQACRDLAGILTKPDDKRALELMATGWAARAAERKRAIDDQSSNVGNQEAQMRILFLALGMFAVATLGDSASAQNYPGCAIYVKGGGMNCGFVTYEQCMATLSGNGGFCNQNTTFVPPPGPH